jgi:dolichol-phosphate mannosyltransferase
MKISVVSPVYGSREILPVLYDRVVKSVENITDNFEIILVNDGSPDEPWDVIQGLATADSRVLGINLSRNFGQHAAITAGLEAATGDWIVVMDCDLQDQPEEIPNFFEKAMNGYDVVLGRRAKRQDTFLKKFFSRNFYRLLGYLTETEQDPSIANFGIYKREVIAAILSMGDRLRYFPAMVRWVGFKTTSIDIEHAERFFGETSYSFRKLVHLACDVILAFSDKPLRIVVKLGAAISSLSFIYAFYIVLKALLDHQEVPGWSSLIVAVSFFSGLIMGVVGLYIGKIFEGTKKRPIFIVQTKTSEKNE